MAWVLESGFTHKQAQNRLAELLAMDEAGLSHELGVEISSKGLMVSSKDFEGVEPPLEKVYKINEAKTQLSDLKEGKSWTRFLGAAVVESKMEKLQESILALGDIYQAARWFYKHPRVVLVGAIRDNAFAVARHADADWIEIPDDELQTPVSKALTTGQWPIMEAHMAKITGPLSGLDPLYILSTCDGLETFGADMAAGRIRYFDPSVPKIVE